MRRIKVSRIVICRGVDPLYVPYLEKVGKHVIVMEVGFTDFSHDTDHIEPMLGVIQNCSHLRSLVYRDSPITKEIIEALCTCKVLEKLSVEGKTEESVDGDTEEYELGDSVEEMDIPYNLQLNLTSLELCCDAALTRTLLKVSSAACLKHLKVHWHHPCMPRVLRDKLQQCPQLTSLPVLDDSILDDSDTSSPEKKRLPLCRLAPTSRSSIFGIPAWFRTWTTKRSCSTFPS